MKTLAIFSNTLFAAAEGSLNSASQKFELRLAKGLSAHFQRVYVISPAVAENVLMDGIFFVHADMKTKRVADFYQAGRDKEITHILFFGYHPLVIRQALRFGPQVKKYSFVFDTHRGMSEFRGPLRRAAINVVFQYGNHLLKRLNGLLLFKQTAYDDIGHGLPYLLTTVPAVGKKQQDLISRDQKDNRYTICYAGALTAYNSVLEMAEAARLFASGNAPVRFVICGSGPLYQALRDAAPDNMVVTGRISEAEVLRWMQVSDLMLNIRRTDEIVNRYAYPSKLIDYLEQGKTVLTTDVDPREPLSEVCFILRQTDAASICHEVQRVMNATEEAIAKRQKIDMYLRQYHNAEKIYSEIYTFLTSPECNR